MKRILIAIVLAFRVTITGDYAYTHGNGGGSEYDDMAWDRE